MLQIQEETGPSIIFLASVWMRLEPSITRILPWSWLCTALFPRMSLAVMLRSFLALALKQFLISTDDDSTAGSQTTDPSATLTTRLNHSRPTAPLGFAAVDITPSALLHHLCPPLCTLSLTSTHISSSTLSRILFTAFGFCASSKERDAGAAETLVVK